jgi:hypothetical protein
MWRALLLALAIGGVSAAARAETCAEVGRIETVQAALKPALSDGHVLRRDGRTDPLAPRVTYLCPGDKIVVNSPKLRVSYWLVGSDQTLQVASGSSPALIPDRGLPKPGLCALFGCRHSDSAKRGARPVVIQTIGRPGALPTVMASAYLPPGEQHLPQGVSTDLALVWSGGPGAVLLDGAPAGDSPSVFLLLTRPKPAAFDLAVKGEDGQVLRWSVKVVRQAPPAPVGFAVAGPPSSEDRLERALWLLEPDKDRTAWRLFALSEIAALRTTSLAADLAWRQVVMGQYQLAGD